MSAYVHHCFFCGWHRPAESSTMLSPSCEKCGGTLRSIPSDELDAVRAEEADQPFVAASRSKDITGLFAGMMVVPWLLPLVGVGMGDIVFLIPLILLVFATARARAAAVREPIWRQVWRLLAVCGALGAVASALAVADSLVAGSVGVLGFYVGAGASVALLGGTAVLLKCGSRRVGWERMVDAGLLGLIAVAISTVFIMVPGFRSGDAALTAVVIIDVAALLCAAFAAVARRATAKSPAEWWLAAGCLAAACGDAQVSAAAAGQIRSLPALTAVLWGTGAFCLASAADSGFAHVREAETGRETATGRWMLGRIVLPLAAVLSFPAIAGELWLTGHLRPWQTFLFAIFFVLALIVAFGRQAYLLADHRRAVVRERKLRREATRRNEELEALTGLAATMTQTLEEAPIMEQALGVLQTAARATSAALQVNTERGLELKAAAGQWTVEREWVDTLSQPEDLEINQRGAREILRVPLAARGKAIGIVTLVRPADQPFDRAGVNLLRLLVDQMGVAVQNARDYREKLEQAIRDPLTGLYNRRFFTESLEKEVQRSERYGSEASVVIFDIDDFKSINDTFGHATGDDVLRKLAEIADAIIRPSDSFARIGGEEFALLLPETPQLEALLVADRLRTALSRQHVLPDRRVTMSGGVASCPGDAMTRNELQKNADAALYWAKRNGKDMCAVASEVTATEAEVGTDGMLAHLYALVAMIDAQHLHTRDHSENVASYAVVLGQALGLEPAGIVRLRRAALLHDIGKVGVSGAILNKPDKLTDAEYTEIKTHPIIGGLMLSHAGLAEEAGWVRHHHERIDGGGYPDRLTGDQIPLEARILFVADSFEAMTSDRPYSAGMEVCDAVAELRRCSGTQFDPDVVDEIDRLVSEDRMTVLALRA